MSDKWVAIYACNAPFIAVGARAVPAGGPAPAAGELEPGVGRVRILDDEARMVLVAGGDDEGTQAAAMALAAHLPYVWDPSGDTLADVTAAVRSVLSAGGVEPTSITVRGLEVRAGTPGLQRADLEIGVAAAQLADTERLLCDACATASGSEPATQATADAAPSFIRSLRVVPSSWYVSILASPDGLELTGSVFDVLHRRSPRRVRPLTKGARS